MNPVHDHGPRCYWDHLRGGWVCRPDPDPEPEPDTVEREVVEH